MLRTNLLSKALLHALTAVCGLLAVSHTASGQGVTAGGFGNFGMGSSSGFGSLGGNTGASNGLQAMGATGAMGGAGGQAGATTGLTSNLGGGGAIGSSFDPSFGASQMASSLATAAAVSRVTSAGMGGGRGGFGGGGFGGGRGGFGGGQNNQNAQSPTKVRAVLRIGFPIEGRTSSATARMVSERFAKMPLPASLGNVQFVLEGRTVVLSGEIEAAEDGKLAERLLSLEPGIDSVRNELVVVASAAEEVPAPVPAR